MTRLFVWHGSPARADLRQFALALTRTPGTALPNSHGGDLYVGRDAVTYAVETSADLQHWTTDGASDPGPDANKYRTAAVNLTKNCHCLRLVVH